MDTEAPTDRPERTGIRTAPLRRGILVLMLLVVVGSVLVWALGRDRLPERIRIATGQPGGLYFKLGQTLGAHLEKRTGRQVVVAQTRGSVENRQLVLSGKANLAMLQAGAIDLEGISPVTPLYHEVVHVVARIDAGIESVGDLRGKSVAIGPRGSGMRHSAERIFKHYRIEPPATPEGSRYFLDLLNDETLDAAVVTTGLLNPDLAELLGSGRFALVPILDAEALSIHVPSFTPLVIPRGFYAEAPPVPPGEVTTVGMTSYLAVRSGASDLLVEETLEALYGHPLRTEVPILFRRTEAARWDDLPLHPAAVRFFQPYGGLGILANLMESLAALKELLFAFGAGLYLLWTQWQRVQARERQAALQAQKDHLDSFLRQTIRIEREVATSDPGRLKVFLGNVTELKLQALEQLTDEDLRGDVTFTIFLQQCSELIRKIQMRVDALKRAPPP